MTRSPYWLIGILLLLVAMPASAQSQDEERQRQLDRQLEAEQERLSRERQQGREEALRPAPPVVSPEYYRRIFEAERLLNELEREATGTR